MQFIHKACLLAFSLAVSSFAIAASNAGSGGTSPQPRSMSSKDTWACEVAMCLSNPQGPTAVAECKPPIDKMRRELAKGRTIPKCPFLGNSSGGGGDTGDDDRDEDRPEDQAQ